VEQRDSEHSYSSSDLQNPAVGAAGVVGSATGGLAKTEDSLGRPTVPALNECPLVRAAALNRGTINGTGLTRPGVGPSRVCGLAKTVAGINVTTIRLTHRHGLKSFSRESIFRSIFLAAVTGPRIEPPQISA
jgi:hypothetical protein